ncbi:MAG: tyrosine-type recombinase/integrase, partial [Actinomycetota bacterium]
MLKRATAFGGNCATASEGNSATAFLRVESGGDLRRWVKTWLADGKAQGWSPRTVRDRETAMDRFLWWVENELQQPATRDALTPSAIRLFLAYAREARPGGRYGSDHPRAKAAARPATVNAYFRIIRAFTNFCLAEGLLKETPLKNVKAPRVPTDQIEPFTEEQVQSLLDAARRGRNPERDAALILLLVDSGMRESEVMGLTIGDVSRGAGELRVVGKGNKERTVHMATKTRRALWRYLETDRQQATAGEALFVGERGTQVGAGLTCSGIYRILRRAGAVAKLSGVRVSPHTCRHTFAISFLRNGGDLFEL